MRRLAALDALNALVDDWGFKPARFSPLLGRAALGPLRVRPRAILRDVCAARAAALHQLPGVPPAGAEFVACVGDGHGAEQEVLELPDVILHRIKVRREGLHPGPRRRGAAPPRVAQSAAAAGASRGRTCHVIR